MLRSLHKRLRTRLVVALCPAQVAIVESTRGWRPRSRNLAVLSCEGVAGEPAWRAPLAALRQWLEQNKYAKTDIEIIVSDSFVRYAVIPWSDNVQSRAELAVLSRIHFETLFGETAAQWEIQADCSTYEAAGVGCALDRTFIAELRELITAHKLRLVSLQPYLMRVFNRWRRRIGDSAALFALVGPGHCVLAGCKGSGWHSIRSFRLGENVNTELRVLIEREIVLQGLDEESAVYIHTVGPVDASQMKQEAKATMLEFPPSMARQPAALAMALCGAS